MIVLPADEAARSISRRLRLSVVAGLAFMLWVMPATRACRELIENRTQIARFRLSENRLPDAFRYSALNIIMMIGIPNHQRTFVAVLVGIHGKDHAHLNVDAGGINFTFGGA